jgi:hypothetical protein
LSGVRLLNGPFKQQLDAFRENFLNIPNGAVPFGFR